MSDIERNSQEPENPENTSRRKFLGAAALTGLAGAGLATGLAALNQVEAKEEEDEHEEGGESGKFEVPPGQLDDYYIFSSGGHSGEVRIYGLPSGRTIKRIPVFNMDPLVGWGITNESKKVIGTKPDGSLKYHTGDTHHVHGSYTDGTYDSKYLWVNDKIHGRLQYRSA
jgi:nitrous-oxide reductase